MAVSSTQVSSSLSLKYKDGIDSKGKDIMKTKKFSNVKVAATDQNVYDTAAALTQLMKYPSIETCRINENMLANI
jgi:hypothetical protein